MTATAHGYFGQGETGRNYAERSAAVNKEPTMKVYFESSPENYVGDFPSITIHYRPQDRPEAERIRALIESGKLSKDADCTCGVIEIPHSDWCAVVGGSGEPPQCGHED